MPLGLLVRWELDGIWRNHAAESMLWGVVNSFQEGLGVDFEVPPETRKKILSLHPLSLRPLIPSFHKPREYFEEISRAQTGKSLRQFVSQRRASRRSRLLERHMYLLMYLIIAHVTRFVRNVW